MNTDFSTEYRYEEFFEEVWDYVSGSLVDDKMWNKYLDKFQEVTFELYNIHKKTLLTLPSGETQSLLSTKVCARIIESFVSNFKSFLD